MPDQTIRGILLAFAAFFIYSLSDASVKLIEGGLTPYESAYKQGRIFSGHYLAHRVTWAMCKDEWPSDQIDHINGIKTDNRLANLRLATSSQNACNRKTRSDNASGLKGANLDKRNGRYRSVIFIDGISYYLGMFETADEAHDAYCQAAAHMHGEFSRDK